MTNPTGLPDDVNRDMTRAINDEIDRRDAVAAGDFVTLHFNQNQSMWELKFWGEPGRSLFLNGFRSLNNSEDNEKVHAIVASWGLRPVGPGDWTRVDGGWRIVVVRTKNEI